MKQEWVVRSKNQSKEKGSNTFIYSQGSAQDCDSWLCWTKVIWLTNSYYQQQELN